MMCPDHIDIDLDRDSCDSEVVFLLLLVGIFVDVHVGDVEVDIEERGGATR